MDPRDARQWWELLRDTALMCTGIVLLVSESHKIHPNPELLAVYMVMMGIPGAIRMFKRNGNGNGNGSGK